MPETNVGAPHKSLDSFLRFARIRKCESRALPLVCFNEKRPHKLNTNVLIKARSVLESLDSKATAHWNWCHTGCYPKCLSTNSSTKIAFFFLDCTEIVWDSPHHEQPKQQDRGHLKQLTLFSFNDWLQNRWVRFLAFDLLSIRFRSSSDLR